VDASNSLVVLPSDTFTQTLLALYFFLAGMLVHSHAWLWLMPLTSTAFVLLGAVTRAVSPLLSNSYALLPASQQARWVADANHLVFSALASVAGVVVVASNPSVIHLVRPVGPGDRCASESAPEVDHLAEVVACCATGFFALHLWVLVRHRVGGAVALLQYTALLLLFGVASYRSIQVGLGAVVSWLGVCCACSAARQGSG